MDVNARRRSTAPNAAVGRAPVTAAATSIERRENRRFNNERKSSMTLGSLVESDDDQVSGKPSRTVTKNAPLPSRNFFAASYSADFQNPQAASLDGNLAMRMLS